MAHNDFFNTGNKGPLGKYEPLYPHDLGRPLKHVEQDYNASLAGQLINGYRVFGTGAQGVPSISDLDKGLKLHEITTTDADYQLYLAAGMEAGDYIWIPAAMGTAQTSPLSILQANVTDVDLCSNPSGGNGVIQLVGSGGTPAYSYRLESPGLGYDSGWVSSATFNSLAAGSYTASIQDSVNNQNTYSGSIVVGTQSAHTVAVSAVDATCFDGSDGQLLITPSGGSAPYTIEVNGQSDQTASEGEQRIFSGLTAGTYQITVTSSNGCVVGPTAQVVGQATQITTTITYYPSSCNGVADNYVVFSNTAGGGGGAPYEYSIDNGSTWQSGASFPNIAVDEVINPMVRDSGGCEESFAQYTYVEPAVITFTAAVQQNVSCNGLTDGSILVSALAGGQTAYSNWEASKDGGSTWSAINGSNSHLFAGLGAGSYDITVRRTDGQGNYSCQGATVTETITEPLAVTHDSPTSTPDSNCSTGNGTITISNIAGGDGTYTASIQSGSTPITQAVTGNSVTFTGVEAGTYNAGVSDGNGCSSVAEQIVVADTSSAPTLQLSMTEPLCAAGSDGQIDWTISGGTAPFDVLLSGGSTDEELGTSNVSGSFQNLVTGSYDVTVNDSLGCSVNANIIVTEPTQVSVTTSHTDETVQGLNDGTITVVVSGGTGTYTIVQIENIATFNGQSSSTPTSGNDTFTFTGVAPGEYQIYTKDSNNCEIGYNTPISIPNVTVAAGTPSLAIDTISGQTPPSTVAVSCNGDTHAPVMVVSGGQADYEFSSDNVNWSSPQSGTTFTFPAVGAGGPYDYYVRDANGISVSAQITITEPSALGGSSSVVHETVVSANDGEITVTPSGGTSPYSVELNGVTISSSPYTFTGLDAATYNYTITDDNGCQFQDSATVNAGTAIVSVTSLAQGNISCNGGTTTVTMTVTGGSGNYEFSSDNVNWSASQTSTTYDFTNISAGSYTFYVKDTDTSDVVPDTITVTEPSQLTYSATITHETVDGYDDGEVVIVLSGGTSTPNYDSVQLTHTVSGAGITIPPQNATNNGTTYTFSSLPDGTYDVYGADANSCQLPASQVTVNQGVTALSATFNFTDQVCPTDDNVYEIIPSGGIGPYFWSADDGASWSSSFTGTHLGYTNVFQARNWKVKDSATPAGEVAYASNPQNFTPASAMTLDSSVGTNGGAFDCSTSSITWTLTVSGVDTSPTIDIPGLSVTGATFSNNGNGTWSYTTPAVTDVTAYTYAINENPNGNSGSNACTAQLTGTLQATGYHTLSVTPTLVTEPACPGDDYQYSFAFSHAVGTYTGQYAYSYDGVSFYGNYTGATLNIPQTGTPTSTVYFRENDPGCSTVVSVNVASQNMTAAAITVTSEDLTPTCYPSQGQFAFTIGGGLSGGAASQFRYALSSDGGSTYGAAQTYSAQVTYSNLATGTYAVKAWRVSSTGATGEANCNDIEFKTVINPTQLTWDTNVVTNDPSGCNTTDGYIRILTVAGGSGGYTFSLTGQGGTYNSYLVTNPGINGGVDYTIGGLDNGTYDVWIKDSNGCTQSIGSYTLQNPSSPVITSFTFDGCQECDLSAPNNLMFEHDATARTGVVVTLTGTSANSITWSDNLGSPTNTTGVFEYPTHPTSTQFTATFTATDDVTLCSTNYSYDSVAAGGRADMLLTDAGSVIVTDNGTGTSDIRIPTTGNFITQYSTTVQVHLLNYDPAGYASIGPGGSTNWQNNVVQSSILLGGSGAGPTFTNVPNGNYMYVIVDQSNNCAAFNPAQIVANAAPVNNRTIYFFHGGGTAGSWPTQGATDLLSGPAFYTGGPGGDFAGGVGTFTADVSGNATLEDALNYMVSFVDPNASGGDVPEIDFGNAPGYESANADFTIQSYDMPIGQTIQDNGDPATRTEFAFPSHMLGSGTAGTYYWMLVPDNSDFPQDLTSSNNYLYDVATSLPTSAQAKSTGQLTINGEDYILYRLAGPATGAATIAFDN